MPVVHCPDCGAAVELPPGTRSGDLVDCPNCAGQPLRAQENAGRWVATLAYQVSCPNCEKLLTLPEGAKPGDVVQCCGRRYRLTFEYGSFAAAEV